MKKISKFEIELVPESTCFNVRYLGVKIIIDGVDFLTRVADFERPFKFAEKVAEGLWDTESLSGSLRIWPRASVQTKSILKGRASYKCGLSEIVGCECGTEFCWPLYGKIIRTKSFVKWYGFGNEHRSSKKWYWPYNEFGPFYFSRKEYDEQIKKIAWRDFADCNLESPQDD